MLKGALGRCVAATADSASASMRELGKESLVSGENASDLRGLKILVIDDSKTIRRTAETLLAMASKVSAVRRIVLLSSITSIFKPRRSLAFSPDTKLSLPSSRIEAEAESAVAATHLPNAPFNILSGPLPW